jgi:nucleoside-diphosphate-sugar epimerase
MSERHVVVGAGPVGRATATQLAAHGYEVVLVSRSGAGESLPGTSRVAADACDADQLTRIAEGAVALYNCVNPPSYDVWPEVWPPLAAALMSAAERTGAVLVTASCLYPYGPVEGAMVEGLPDTAPGVKARIRAGMWADALAAHRAGRIRTVEVRGSDYMGPGVGDNGHVSRLVPDALAGKTVRVIGSADQPHSWTDVRDMARALVAVAADESTWGRVWHAPTNPPRTQRQAITDVCRSVGKEPGRITNVPRWAFAVFARFNPIVRQLTETYYQFESPYVLDSSAISRELGLDPTPWDEVCRGTAASGARSQPVAG